MFVARGPFATQEAAKKSLTGCVNPLCRYWVEEREDGWVVMAEQIRRSRSDDRSYRDEGPRRRKDSFRPEPPDEEEFDDWDLDIEGGPDPDDD